VGSYRVSGSESWTVMIVPIAELVLVSLFEEILFRGVIFRIIEGSLGSWIGILLSGVIFGLAHLPNGGVPLLAFAATIMAGVMLAAAFMTTRRLWLAVGLHFAWNFEMDAVFSVAVSGHPANGLLHGTLVGADWLTGGAYGVEGSVVALAVVSAASLYFIALARRRGNVVLPFWRRGAAGHAALEAATASV
jgi:uncharacterized protein